MSKNKFLTVMIIPHSTSRVYSFKIPVLLVKAAAASTATLALILLFFAMSYRSLAGQAARVPWLEQTTATQSAEIARLAATTDDLNRRMQSVYALDQEVRRILGFEMKNAEPSPTASAGPTGISRFRVASLTSRNGLVRPAKPTPPDQTDSTQQLKSIPEIHQEQADISQAITVTINSLEQLRKVALDRQDYLASVPSGWPAWGMITSGFGYRRHPITGYSEFHRGIDIAGAYGAPIAATGKGTVVYAGWKAGYGLMIIVNHGYGYQTTYAHCSRLLVHYGQEVKRGQVIAYIGQTGTTTGPHVHYEVLVNGVNTNPLNYLK